VPIFIIQGLKIEERFRAGFLSEWFDVFMFDVRLDNSCNEISYPRVWDDKRRMFKRIVTHELGNKILLYRSPIKVSQVKKFDCLSVKASFLGIIGFVNRLKGHSNKWRKIHIGFLLLNRCHDGDEKFCSLLELEVIIRQMFYMADKVKNISALITGKAFPVFSARRYAECAGTIRATTAAT